MITTPNGDNLEHTVPHIDSMTNRQSYQQQSNNVSQKSFIKFPKTEQSVIDSGYRSPIKKGQA